MIDQELATLRESLTFLHVSELREVAAQLNLESKGSKMAIVMRILVFMKTGQKLISPKFPDCSCAKRGQRDPLEATAFMLKGSYKNDLKTRFFFKKIIGEHFHFTAFGIDWLNERWMLGDPPTYQEFADMWEHEYRKRQKTPASPKEEWAYIRFVQGYLNDFPESSRNDLNAAWENERKRHKSIVQSILGITLFEEDLVRFKGYSGR
jgi:hypothetical protein